MKLVASRSRTLRERAIASSGRPGDDDAQCVTEIRENQTTKELGVWRSFCEGRARCARAFRRHLQESTSLIPARSGVGALFVVKVCAPTMTSRWSDLIT